MSLLSDQQYRNLFETAAGKILVLLPRSYEIVAVSKDYLKATLTREEDLVGRRFLEVLQNAPADLIADGFRTLEASLRRVESLKTRDIMAIMPFPIALPGGGFEERFWSPVNSPVLNTEGEIEFIIHRLEDVTEVIGSHPHNASKNESWRGTDSLETEDIVVRYQELRESLSKLQEQEVRLHAAESLLKLGTWEFNLDTGQFTWSERVFEICGLSKDKPAPDLEAYFQLVHPDDIAQTRALYQNFVEKVAPRIEFQHRVIKQDGTITHVRGVGERHGTSTGDIVVGFVQDITQYIKTEHSLSQAQQLLQLAGEKVRLGGWRIELDTETIIWTPETAAIHEVPSGFLPASIEEGMSFYAPQYRETIFDQFQQCVLYGEEFDFTAQLVTYAGKQLWVRVIGVPESDELGTIIAVQGAIQDISSLRDAQKRADEAEQNRRNIIESISDAFYALDKEWNFTYLNKQAEIEIEHSRDHLIGKNVWKIFPDAVGSAFQSQFQHAMNTGNTVKFSEFYPPLNKWFEVTAYSIPTGLAVYFRDITPERQRQQQLQLVETALARQNDIVIITTAGSIDTPDGLKIVYVNDALERITGYSKEEVIGKTPRIFNGKDTDRGELRRIGNALRNNEPVRAELLNYTRSGEPFWLDIDISPLIDEHGNCTHFLAVEQDITLRKQQESELLLNQERFRLISKATNDVIWDWDFMSKQLWWNDAMYHVFGHVSSDLEPGIESWTSRIHPDDFDRVYNSIHEVVDDPAQEHWSSEYRFIKGDGQYATVIDRGFVIREPSGKAVRMVGSMLDMTDRIELEQRLRESQKLEAIGHLTGGVAHDFNNLLTVIIGNSEELADRLRDDKLHAIANMTVSAAGRAAELTNRLLAFARRQPLEPEPININRLISEMEGIIRRTLPGHVDVEFVGDSSIGTCEIDSSQFETALLNLVVNARDAMPDGGKLTIETATTRLDQTYASRHPEVIPGEYVMVCVSDTGTGIDQPTLNRVFEPFFTTKVSGKGSGLGLSMVFGFTRQSEGHIKIYSEVGEGTSVKLYFPKSTQLEKISDNQEQDDSFEGGSEYILVAEDDDLVREHLAAQLTDLGYHVTTAGSGPEALAILDKNSKFELLLTDIIMPGGMNGKELADQALIKYPWLKVLYTSGYTENAIVHHGRLDPGVDLLSKPYRRQELARKVRKVLGM